MGPPETPAVLGGVSLCALERLGALFIAEDEHTGYGVRQKFNSVKAKRLETWEGEGGPAYEDDI
ncbi:hypothetical protein F7P69_14650 [Cellulosimicrobium funkei]|nr:hypothetical protein [Cellulosimicrobium funkei]